MKAKITNPIQPDWYSKIFAGGILGLSLSVAIANLIVIIGVAYFPISILAQFAMWSVPFLWLPIFFACFYIAQGKMAVLYLLMLNVLVYVLVFSLRG